MKTSKSPSTTSSIILKISNTKDKNINPKAPQYTNLSNFQISQILQILQSLQSLQSF